MQEKIKSISLLAFTVLLFLSCSLQEPVMPSWKVPILVPLGTKRFSFQEEIANRNSVITRGDTLYINITGEFDPRHITESDLTIPGRDTTMSVEIGVMSLDSILTHGGEPIILSDAFPELSHRVGETVTIPETTLTFSPLTVESGDFRKALIKKCDIQICITNNFPLTVGSNRFSPNGMEIEVYDSIGTLVAGINIDEEVPSGGNICTIKPMTTGDVWIHAPLRLEYALPVSEDTTFVLTGDILDNSWFDIEISLLDLEIREVIGNVPPQRITRNIRVAMPDGDGIISGTIFSGSMEIDLHNQIPLGAEMDITLPDLRSPGSIPVSERVTLAPSGYSSASVDLKDVTISNSGSPGSPLDSLLIDIEAETEQSDGFVHLRSSDNISVTVHMGEIAFSDLEGYLATRSFQMGPFEENDIIDYGGLSGGFNFRHGQLMLVFLNELDIENLNLDMNIAGYRREDGEVLIDSAGIKINDYRISPGRDTFLLSGGQVVDLLDILPTDIVCYGSLEYWGYMSVSAGEGIRCEYSISTPFEIEIQDPEPVEFDTDTLREKDIDETFRDAAGDDITSAVLNATIVNHSPLGGEVLLLISADPSRSELYDISGYSINPLEFIKSVEMTAASVDPVTGFVENAAVSEVGFPISGDQLSVFNNPPVITGFLLILEETAGRVIVRGSDYIEISGDVEFEVHIRDKE